MTRKEPGMTDSGKLESRMNRREVEIHTKTWHLETFSNSTITFNLDPLGFFDKNFTLVEVDIGMMTTMG